MEMEDFQGLELPYVNNELSMIIFLPKQIGRLADFETKLTAENLSQWQAKLRKREVIVSVPKFKETCQFGLADVLKQMGMTDAFTAAADFSGMNGKKELFISEVIHKAFVDVNEEGTEAAAATGVVVGLTSVGPKETPVFRADHPFLFLIRDNKSGSVLFIGRVMNPKQ
jgi:serpin B